MPKHNKILTICIPTFNRSNFLEKQIYFFHSQIINNTDLLNSVRFIISDNASTDDTQIIISSLSKDMSFFDYNRNSNNLGLIGNIITLINLSTTDYIWVVSDDDSLKNGIIEMILNAIHNCNPEYIFINYETKSKIGYTGQAGCFSKSKDIALKIFDESYGSLVFITTCVYKRTTILELNKNEMFTWISAPMLFSFYACAKGSIYIIGDPMIIFNPGNASYRGLTRILKIKFEEYISILEILYKFGYNKNKVANTIKHFFKHQSHSHFLYNFINPQKSLAFYKRHYNISTYISLPINIIKYLLGKINISVS